MARVVFEPTTRLDRRHHIGANIPVIGRTFWDDGNSPTCQDYWPTGEGRRPIEHLAQAGHTPATHPTCVAQRSQSETRLSRIDRASSALQRCRD
jgi:hypothetical protein